GIDHLALIAREHRDAGGVHAEAQRDVEALLLVEAAFLGQEQGPLRAAPVGIVDRDLAKLRRLRRRGLLLFRATDGGKRRGDHHGEACAEGRHADAPWTSSLNTFFALSSKISFLSASLNHSKSSMM